MKLLATICSVIAAATLLHAAAANADSYAELRGPNGTLFGVAITRSDGRVEARSSAQRYLGFYDPHSNATYDQSGRLIARGNALSALILGDGNLPSSRPNVQKPSYDEALLVPHEVAARHALMKPAITRQDRELAIQALQIAAAARGKRVPWQNHQSGNTGTYVVSDDRYETYVNGNAVTCYWAIMTLRAAGQVDMQRQGICRRADNGAWTVTVVDADYYWAN